MALPVIPNKLHVLVVDDEPDVVNVTKLSLKGLKYEGRRLKLVAAETGEAAVEALRHDPMIAVVLLDVVMENDHAGLDACRAIREELGNHTVRILLRTGQPGSAPERETIEQYDIDGYLPKAEMTSTRLFSAVRTALKAWRELVELERHRESLAAIHELSLSLHSYEPLNTSLNRLLGAATTVCPSDLVLLQLQTFDAEGDSESHRVRLTGGEHDASAEARAEEIAKRIGVEAAQGPEPHAFEGGVLVPISIHRGLGYGWIYLADAEADELARKALTLLAAHAANALYASVAQHNLEESQGPVFDQMAI